VTLWHVERTGLFVKSCKRLPLVLQRRTDDAMLALAGSERPADLGIPKGAASEDTWLVRLVAYRLVYKVLDRQRIILMVVVGDHRGVYWKD